MKQLNSLPCTINSYTFIKLIARGGFASVFLVTSSKYTGKYCAKVMTFFNKEGEAQITTVENEIKTLKNLNHPHIIRLYDSFFENDLFFMILEFCPGGNLLSQILNSQGLPLDKFIEYAKQIIQALSFCHEQSIAHHDIKPENILIDAYGRVKLADFGISLHIDQNLLSDSFSGSFMYEAPEIVQKKIHNPFQADIWALGVLFAFMINGSSPWKADTVGAFKSKICSASYYLRASTPTEIKDMIKKMIVVNPEDRISISDLERHPAFEVTGFSDSVASSDSVPDVLSPSGRSQWHQRQKRVIQRTGPQSYKAKSITIFQYNDAGGKTIPRLKSRFHIPAQSTFSESPNSLHEPIVID